MHIVKVLYSALCMFVALNDALQYCQHQAAPHHCTYVLCPHQRGAKVDPNEAVVIPADLSAMTREQLQALQTQALAEFDTLAADENITDDGVARLETLAGGIESLTTALTALPQSTVTAGSRAAATRDRVAKMRPAAAPTATAQLANKQDTGTNAPVEPVEPVEPAEPVTASGSTTSRAVSLAAASANAPVVPAKTSDDLVITAAAATSGIQIGSRFNDSDAMVAAFQGIARSLAPSHGNPSFQNVATIHNTFEHVVDLNTKLNDIDTILQDIRSVDAIEALVAGGGWCSPSEIRYDFFNVTCQDGAIDLPTVGIRRGGIQFPTSPSLADVYTGSFTNATNPWLWQEIDDESVATGSGITKPCVRVTCPSFSEARLECYGICLTAGNLTDYAYPEATRNHLALLMAAHYHAMNARYITTMVNLSTDVGTIPASGTGILSDAPAVTALAAQDYRTRYGMCDNDVLEVVFPRWVKDAMRIDHLRRNGFWASPLSDADINKLFTANRVRVQWVNDWQVRGVGQPGYTSAITSWPDTVQFMIYAAGTFIRGNGLTLDLGVVRDSVLNADNDHTAAWTEECHLIARVGHESRLYTIPVCTAGRTGANDVTCALTE